MLDEKLVQLFRRGFRRGFRPPTTDAPLVSTVGKNGLGLGLLYSTVYIHSWFASPVKSNGCVTSGFFVYFIVLMRRWGCPPPPTLRSASRNRLYRLYRRLLVLRRLRCCLD